MIPLCGFPFRRFDAAILLAAVLTVASTVACSARSWARPPSAGFWYESGPFELPSPLTPGFDAPLSQSELRSIEQLSRLEIDRAFSMFGVTVTEDRTAFWRVRVLRSLPPRMNRALPRAGESLALGLLGGTGAVAFDVVAGSAMQYAPAGASREQVVDGIGRGIGRVAVHEFMHQMLGVSAAHNDRDPNSYEYGGFDRPSQYYGDLHWTTALPLLRQKFGE